MGAHTVRDAAIRDNWRRVYESDYPRRLLSIKLSDIAPLGNTEITFAGGITAICGANGVGKSTLLRIIAAAVAQMPPNVSDPRNPVRSGGSATAVYQTAGPHSLSISRAGPECSPPIDKAVSILSLDAMVSFSQQAGKGEITTDILDAITPRPAEKHELDTLRYILGKDYTKVETFEVTEFGDDPIPFFRVCCDGVNYDSNSMGLGELAIHLMLWQLDQAEPMSILLLEEPETFVAPFSQEALLNVIAERSAQKKIWTIFTTHSPNLLGRVPLEHIRLISRAGSQTRVIVPSKRSVLLDSLRIAIPLQGFLFVEDFSARAFAVHLIDHFSFAFSREFEVCYAGSTSHIETILNAFPRTNRINIIGVFDGDQRNNGISLKWPHVFLPGDFSPERAWRIAAMRDIAALAKILDRDENSLASLLSGIEHLDDHDWPVELAKMLGYSLDQLCVLLFKQWVSFSDNATLGQQFVADLEKALDECR